MRGLVGQGLGFELGGVGWKVRRPFGLDWRLQFDGCVTVGEWNGILPLLLCRTGPYATSP